MRKYTPSEKRNYEPNSRISGCKKLKITTITSATEFRDSSKPVLLKTELDFFKIQYIHTVFLPSLTFLLETIKVYTFKDLLFPPFCSSTCDIVAVMVWVVFWGGFWGFCFVLFLLVDLFVC